MAFTLSEEDPILGKRAHVEVHVAAYPRAIAEPYWPASAMAKRLARKFNEPHVRAEVLRRLKESYNKVLVSGSYGRTKTRW